MADDKSSPLKNGVCFSCLVMTFVVLVSNAQSQTDDCQWPAFLGPAGNNHVASPHLPTEWSEDQHIDWKTPIHGRGWSSPVIAGGKLWMTTATEDGTRFFAVSVDQESGSIVHDIELFRESNPRFCHDMNSYASPTPAIEPGRVYLHFGSYGTACVDTESGELIWDRDDLECDHFRGPGSSPILFEDLLIIHFDGADFQYVVALDKHDSTTRWRVDREIDYGTDDGDIMKAYSTPTVIELGGEPLMISSTSKACIAMDPRSGDERWRITHDDFSATARPVFDGTNVIINTGFSKAKLLCVDPNGEGDVTATHVKWTVTRNVGSKPTPLHVDGLIYLLTDHGIASCVDAVSGEIVWTERLGGQFSSSPLYNGTYVYFSSHEGVTTVIRPGREYDQVAQNQLDDGFMASPAVDGDALYLRSRTHLYRIQTQESPQ